MTDRSLVTPASQYDVTREHQRNRRVEELLKTKANRGDLLAFTGIPAIQLTGTNAAFSVPPNVPTLLPWDVVVLDNPALVTNGKLQPKYDVQTMLFLRLRHNAASGGNVDVIIEFFVNGILWKEYGYAARANDVFDISDMYAQSLDKDSLYEIKVTHSFSTAMLFDMTNSTITALQLSPDPSYLSGIERY